MCMAYEEVRLHPRAPSNLSDENPVEDCKNFIEGELSDTKVLGHLGCDNDLKMVQIENTFSDASTLFCWNGEKINMLPGQNVLHKS